MLLYRAAARAKSIKVAQACLLFPVSVVSERTEAGSVGGQGWAKSKSIPFENRLFL